MIDNKILDKLVELAAKYVTMLYQMHSSQSVQRMHHLQVTGFEEKRSNH